MKARTLVYLACAFVSGYAAARFVDEHQGPNNPYRPHTGPNSPHPTGDNSMSDPTTSPQVRLGTAVDRVTSAFATECRRIATALANANSHTNQIDIDPQIAGLNKLADLMDGTNETNILTYADNPAVISTPTSPSPGDPLAAGQPVGQATNTSASNSPPSQVGVSDSNNPLSPLSPSPLGSQQPLIQGTGAPTDAVVADNAGINAANATSENAPTASSTPEGDSSLGNAGAEPPIQP